MDRHTPEQRRKNMRAIKSKDTKAELLLRKALWHKGYRYYKNYKSLPGKPDIVFIKSKIAVFVDGEFWHGYDWDQNRKKIQTNKEFWISKIERNIERDREINFELKKLGWVVLRFWSKDVEKNLDVCIKKIEKKLESNLDSNF